MTSPQAKILLVEDNRLIAFGLRRELQSLGYAVDAAHCGEEAFQSARRLHPDIIVMDVNLGEHKDGIDLMRDIHAEIGFISNVYLTGYADNEIAGRAAATAPLGIFEKPVDITQLQAVLAQRTHASK